MSNDAEEQQEIDREVQETLKIIGNLNYLEIVERKFSYDFELYSREITETSKELIETSQSLIEKSRSFIEKNKRRRDERWRNYI